MLMVNQLIGFGVGGVDTPSIIFASNYHQTPSQASYTFSTATLGSLAAGRRIIVGAGSIAGTSETITSLTVAGNAATQVVANSAASSIAGLFIIADAVNSTGDIVVTFSGSVPRCSIGVWAAYDLISSTATDSDQNISDPLSAAMDISAGGIAVAYAITGNIGAFPAFSWTGITESYDQQMEDNVSHSGAALAFSAAQTGLTITADPTGTFSQGRIVMAAFR